MTASDSQAIQERVTSYVHSSEEAHTSEERIGTDSGGEEGSESESRVAQSILGGSDLDEPGTRLFANEAAGDWEIPQASPSHG